MYVCIQILIKRKGTSRMFESFIIYLCVTYEIKQTFENSSPYVGRPVFIHYAANPW